MFDLMDADGDGKISFPEFEKVSYHHHHHDLINRIINNDMHLTFLYCIHPLFGLSTIDSIVGCSRA